MKPFKFHVGQRLKVNLKKDRAIAAAWKNIVIKSVSEHGYSFTFDNGGNQWGAAAIDRWLAEEILEPINVYEAL